MNGVARAVVQAALRAVGLPANALENVLDEVQLTPSVKTASALQGVDSKGMCYYTESHKLFQGHELALQVLISCSDDCAVPVYVMQRFQSCCTSQTPAGLHRPSPLVGD